VRALFDGTESRTLTYLRCLFRLSLNLSQSQSLERSTVAFCHSNGVVLPDKPGQLMKEVSMPINPPIGSLAPVGTVVAYAGTRASLQNSGWLICDGGSVSALNYPLLVRVLGNLYGGDGVTIAYLPDMRGMFIRGVDDGAGVDPDVSSRTPATNGTTGVGSTQVDALANHQHNWDHFFYNFDFRGNDIACHQPPDSGNLQNNTRQATNNDGGVKTGSSGAETRPKNIALYWIIKAG
jgi:rhizosphere induced protein